VQGFFTTAIRHLQGDSPSRRRAISSSTFDDASQQKYFQKLLTSPDAMPIMSIVAVQHDVNEPAGSNPGPHLIKEFYHVQYTKPICRPSAGRYRQPGESGQRSARKH
jgi:hypothetical protein